MSDAPDISAMSRHELEAYTRTLWGMRAEFQRVEALYKSAIEVFGADSRMRLMQEECGELIAAVAQFVRGRVGVLELAEELADVEIMCGQSRLLVGSGAVEAAKGLKLARLDWRVQGGCDV